MSICNIFTINELTWHCKDISLRQPCRKLTTKEIANDWFMDLVKNMFETLFSTPSGVGLAAPQLGIQIQLIIIDIKRDGKKPLVLINPRYIPLSNEKCESLESCLSVPGKKGIVMRYKKIEVEYMMLNGEVIKRQCDGFESRVLQHEIDHLEGCLYIDRIDSPELISDNLGVPNALATKAVENLRNKFITER